MSRPAVVFHGNCQADVLGACFTNLPGVAERYEVKKCLTFAPVGSEAYRTPSVELLDRCEVVVLQVTLKRAEPSFIGYAASRGAKIVRFPMISCPQLWPQDCPDARNRPEEKYPFGRYPYGDRLLLDLMEQGKSEDEIVEEYLATDLAGVSSLERVTEYWRYSLAEMDARCDIKVRGFLEKNFQDKRLFHTRNHPSYEVMRFVFAELLCRAWGDGIPRAHIDFAASVPTDCYVTPVHPSVSRALDLKWCGEETLHRHWGNGWFTHREFARRYVRYEG